MRTATLCFAGLWNHVWNHVWNPGSVIVASVGSGAQLPHADVATHPEVLRPDSKDISGCHLSSFPCLSEDYQVALQGGTALGEAGEAHQHTILLQRGDMLLMVATSCHHGLAALPDSKDELQGALFNLWTPDPRHRRHQPNTTHLDPPPLRGPGRCWDLASFDFPNVDQVLWVGKGAVGRVGLWEGGAAQALFADAPEAFPAGPPTCPYHPTFPSRSAPSSDLAVMEIAEQSILILPCGECAPDSDVPGGQHQCGVGDPLRHVGRRPPGAADHAVASAQHSPSVAVAQIYEGRGMVNHMSM